MIGYVKKLLIGLIFLIFSLPFFGNGFEGSIMLIKESCYDTTFFTYYVADNKIRIEESNSKKVLQNVYIINIVTEDVFIINPEKKLYTKLRKKNQADNEEKHFTIKKTTNSKLVNGIRCYQWRVKNREKNAEISYWVTQNDFNFFEKMVKILNQTERSWEFFNHIPETQGYLPILCVERNLVRDEKMRTSVLQINRKTVDSSLFRIPVGYKLFAI
jgi:hypothetical protein